MYTGILVSDRGKNFTHGKGSRSALHNDYIHIVYRKLDKTGHT